MSNRPTWRKLTRKLRKIPVRLWLAQRHVRTPFDRRLVLDLESHYRFGPFLMAAFAGRGYSVEIVKGGAFVPDAAMLFRMGLGMVSVERSGAAHPRKTLIHDSAHGVAPISGQWGRVVQLDYDYYGKRPDRTVGIDDVFGPYFMHPKAYEAGLHDRVVGLRSMRRTMRVFFAGTVSSEADARGFRWSFPNRHQVIRAVLESFPDDVQHVRGGADKHRLLRSRQAIVLALTGETTDTIDKHLLTQEEMLRFAAASDFFINPPGIVNPHSHNVIEAMSVGAIPILSYGDLFDPALVDMETCIAYRDVSDFVRKLRSVLTMPEDDIRRMRRNVCRYYDDHLSPDALFRRWSALQAPNVRLRMHNAHVLARPEYVRAVAS